MINNGVSARKLVYDFRRKNSSFFNASNRDINLVDIIGYLNEAQGYLIRGLMPLAEVNTQIKDDLMVLFNPKVCLPCVAVNERCCKVTYPDDYFKRMRQVAEVCKDCCPGSKVIPIDINQTDDISETNRNTFMQADYFYEMLPGQGANDGFLVHHNGEMEIKKVCIDYYRKPQEIHAPSLVKCKGPKYYDYCGQEISKDQDFELSCRYLDIMLVDIASLVSQGNIKDVAAFQSQLTSIINVDKIVKNN